MYMRLKRILSTNHWLCLGIIMFGIWAISANANLYATGDTKDWTEGAKWLGSCLSNLGFDSCQKLSKWPIWNHLIAFVFSRLSTISGTWQSINIAAFTLYLYVTISAMLSLSFMWRFFLLISILVSPLLFYINSTFTEIQQGLFLTLGLSSLINKKPLISTLFIVLSIAAKESLLICWLFVLFGLLLKEIYCSKFAIHFFKEIVSNLRKSIYSKTVIAGIIIGTVINLWFNYIRYHQITNRSYLDEHRFLEMNLDHFVSNAWWSLFSPNGGLLVSYGLFFSIVVFYIFFNKIQHISHPESGADTKIKCEESRQVSSRLEELPIIISAVFLSGLMTTSAWGVTFGWDTWGFRLFVPYIMALVTLIILAISDETSSFKTSSKKSMKLVLPKNSRPVKKVSRKFILRKICLVSVVVTLSLLSLTYNLTTIQAVYREDKPVIHESLYSQKWCQEMMAKKKKTDSYGASYHWRCTLERFKYIPILHHPPEINDTDRKRLALIAYVALAINFSFTKLQQCKSP